jgi:MinD-like ATPase involved in chromosome partitioning or flagellar assembly
LRTITFYSYKGGTGRTLAVANTARFLARFGLKVFVLDFDLEAPGLHYKLGLRSQEEEGPLKGLVDFIHSFTVTDVVPELAEYVAEIQDLPREFTGKILLMPAGNAPSPEYSQRLAEIRLADLFNTRGESDEIPQAVPLFMELKERIARDYDPDYLLIDSRTGVTEIGGVAVRLMPDTVVCLLHQNKENLAGARGVLRSIRSNPPEPIEIVVVLARIPEMPLDEEKQLLDRVQDYFNRGDEGLNLDEITPLHSDPNLQVEERLLVGADVTANESTLLRDYFKLFRKLGMDKHLNPVERGVIQELAQADRNEGVRPLILARRSLGGESSVAKIRMRARITSRPDLVLKVVAPAYLDRPKYKTFIGKVRENLADSFSPAPKTDPVNEVRWDLLAVHLREGVLDFCDDLYYLTESRGHLVEVVQLGWSHEFVAYARKDSPVHQALLELPDGRFAEVISGLQTRSPGVEVGVLGDTPAASEANRNLSQLLKAAELISKGSEEDLFKWLSEKDQRVAICDRVIADKLNEISEKQGGNYSIPRSFRFARPIPVGIVYPREDREWRKDLAQAIAATLLEVGGRSRKAVAKTWQEVASDCARNGIEALSLAELRISLLLDLPFERAVAWDGKFQAAQARESLHERKLAELEK